MPLQAEVADVLRASFPAGLAADLAEVFRIMPEASHPPMFDGPPTRIGGESIAVLARVYSQEPPSEGIDSLTDVQRAVLSCVYSRHADGRVRERHIRRLLREDRSWVPPFVLQVLGEYVIQIGQAVLDGVDGMPRDTYQRFAEENPDFMGRVRERVVSYWTCYHRHVAFVEYPCYRALTELGIWAGPDARRRIRRRR